MVGTDAISRIKPLKSSPTPLAATLLHFELTNPKATSTLKMPQNSIIRNIAVTVLILAFFALPFSFFEHSHLSELSLFSAGILAAVIRKTRQTPAWQILISLISSAFFTAAIAMSWMPQVISGMEILPDYFAADIAISAVALFYHALPLILFLLIAFMAIRKKNLPLILAAPAIYGIALKIFPSVVPCDAYLPINNTIAGQLLISAIGYESTRYLLATGSLIFFGYFGEERHRPWIWTGTASLTLAVAALTATNLIASSKEVPTQPIMSLMAMQPGYYDPSPHPDGLRRDLSEANEKLAPDAFVFSEGFRQLKFTQLPEIATRSIDQLKKATITTSPVIVVTERHDNTPHDADGAVILQTELIADGDIRAHRTKESTILFAENVPDWIKGLNLLPYRVKAISSGDRIFPLKERSIAPLICFELWDETVVQKSVKMMPDALLALSSLNMFGFDDHFSYQQVLHQTFLRAKQVALEHKIPVAVAISGGGSFAVNSRPGQLYDSVPKAFGETFALLNLEKSPSP